MIGTHMPLIEVRDLFHTYLSGTAFEVCSLNGIHLKVFPNETVGIIGPAGSGKSTLLHHLNGLLRPMKGDVLIRGISIFQWWEHIKEIRMKIGLVFQNPERQLFEQFAGDDVAFGPRNIGLDPAQVRMRVKKAMEMVGIPFLYKDRLTSQLSLGEKRRLALAGVLAMDPQVLVLDEPTANLDPDGRRRLLGVLSQWRISGNRALVIASHNMEDIVELADRVYVLVNGEVVVSGSTREVFSQYDVLVKNGLAVPPALELLHGLKQLGYPVSLDILTIEEAAIGIKGLYDA
jgi:energy-coupling factor transport system ATP-binding protein